MPDTPKIPLPAPALEALGILNHAGHQAWCVGGCVRDAYLGSAVHDIDIATDAHWKQTQAVFSAAGCKTFETGTKHGTITVKVGDDTFEVTTFRTDGTYSDARHPDSVQFVETIEEDLARRDFTMNAMAYHPHHGLVDPYGGRLDIDHQRIVAVGNPEIRFGEDALRILRALRFASKLGFSIVEDTAEGMRLQKEKLQQVATERIAREIEGMLLGASVHDVIMNYTDILSEVLPELSPMQGLDQRTPYHIYDVLEHTAYVVANTPPYPLARWCGLLHDMGKPACFTIDDEGVGHFYGHPAVSVEITHKLGKRLKLSAKFLHDAELIVKYHDTQFPPTAKSVKRMLRKLDGRPDLFATLCDVKRADALSQAPQCKGRVALADQLQNILTEILKQNEAFTVKDLALGGNDVIAAGIPAGPLVGRALDAALDAVIDEAIPNEKQALRSFVADWHQTAQTSLH